MVVEVHVEGFDAYQKEVEENKGKTIFALFCGSKNENGDSWCPDCVVGQTHYLFFNASQVKCLLFTKNGFFAQ